MPRVNLLPWREEQRKERKLQFTLALGGATLAAIALTFIAYLMFASMISAQQSRNALLRAQIKVLDKKIEKINKLEDDKKKFVARMDIIEKLQRSRPEIVHVFDQIVRTIPDGVYLTSVKQTGDKFRFDGVAQSSTRVSTFMRNIDKSDWLQNPELQVIQTRKGESGGSSFTLYAQEVSTDTDQDNGSTAGRHIVARRGSR